MEEAYKLDKGQVGIAGEFYALAELAGLGYNSLRCLKNNPVYDIMAYDDRKNEATLFQVKTSRPGYSSWSIGAERCRENDIKPLFYIFVKLKKPGYRPDFYIVPSKIIKQYIANHMRKLDVKEYKDLPSPHIQWRDNVDNYFERWDLIKNN